MSLAQKIKSLRENNHWSYSDLARVAGIPQPTIWRLEKGKVEHHKADTLVALGKAFKVPIDYLVQDDYELKATDLLRVDNSARAMIETYTSLSEEDRKKVKHFTQYLKTQYLKPRTPAGEKQRFVDVVVKARRVKKE